MCSLLIVSFPPDAVVACHQIRPFQGRKFDITRSLRRKLARSLGAVVARPWPILSSCVFNHLCLFSREKNDTREYVRDYSKSVA